jgi:hypothetical protein
MGSFQCFAINTVMTSCTKLTTEAHYQSATSGIAIAIAIESSERYRVVAPARAKSVT